MIRHMDIREKTLFVEKWGVKSAVNKSKPTRFGSLGGPGRRVILLLRVSKMNPDISSHIGSSGKDLVW